MVYGFVPSITPALYTLEGLLNYLTNLSRFFLIQPKYRSNNGDKISKIYNVAIHRLQLLHFKYKSNGINNVVQ